MLVAQRQDGTESEADTQEEDDYSNEKFEEVCVRLFVVSSVGVRVLLSGISTTKPIEHRRQEVSAPSSSRLRSQGLELADIPITKSVREVAASPVAAHHQVPIAKRCGAGE